MDEIKNVEIINNDYKILIVDDIISNTLLLRAQLRNENYQIITASDGFTALELVEKEMPDLILLDVMMEGLSGFDVARELKKSPKYKNIPFIFITALNNTSDVVKGFQFGASDFITKPFNKEELLMRVSRQISQLAIKRLVSNRIKTDIDIHKILDIDISEELQIVLADIKSVFSKITDSLSYAAIDEELIDVLDKASASTKKIFIDLNKVVVESKCSKK